MMEVGLRVEVGVELVWREIFEDVRVG